MEVEYSPQKSNELVADRIGLDPSDSRSFLFFALVLGDLKVFLANLVTFFLWALYGGVGGNEISFVMVFVFVIVEVEELDRLGDGLMGVVSLLVNLSLENEDDSLSKEDWVFGFDSCPTSEKEVLVLVELPFR